MTKIILLLKHKVSGKVKELRFKMGLRFANKIRKHMKDYDLVGVRGNDRSPIVQYLRSQIGKYEESLENYNIDAGELFRTVASETKTDIDHVKKSLKRIPKRFRKFSDEG